MPNAPIEGIISTADFRPKPEAEVGSLAIASSLHSEHGYGVAEIPKELTTVDSSADLMGAAAAVSPEKAQEMQSRFDDIARKRRRAARSPLLKRGLL